MRRLHSLRVVLFVAGVLAVAAGPAGAASMIFTDLTVWVSPGYDSAEMAAHQYPTNYSSPGWYQDGVGRIGSLNTAIPSGYDGMFVGNLAQSANNGVPITEAWGPHIPGNSTYLKEMDNSLFMFNSVSLKLLLGNSGPTPFVISAYDNSPIPNLMFSQVINLTSAYQNFTFNWANVDVVYLGANYGTGGTQFDINHFEFNDTPVPEPGTMFSVLGGCGALIGYFRLRRGRAKA